MKYLKLNFFKLFLKNIIQLFLFKFFQRKSIFFSGVYTDWKTANKFSQGYDNDIILKNVFKATKLVLSKKAAYERDGIAFKKKTLSYELLLAVFCSSIENKSKCVVLDFGGSLGSVYFQNRDLLKIIKNLKWCIVEQKNFVNIGKKYFSNNILNFYDSFEQVKNKHKKIDLVIFSSVLQYLEKPYQILNKAIDSEANYILIDRNPFITNGNTKISIQKTPKSITESNYPVRLFNEKEFKKIFYKKYEEIAKFDALDGTIGYGKLKAEFKGFIFKKLRK